MEKFEDVKDRRCVFLINQEVNKDWINDVLYIPINDMAIVFYIAGRKDKKEEPVKYIEKSIYKKWGVDLEKIKTIALNNTERLLPAKIETPLEVLSHIYTKTYNIRTMEEAALLSDCFEESFYSLSNDQHISIRLERVDRVEKAFG